jgi:peroxiredoxin family protein
MSDEAMVATGTSAVEEEPKRKKVAMVVMSGDMDKLFGAFIIGSGAAAMGMDVVMFFTFWGLRALKKPVRTGTSFFGKMLGAMYGGDIRKSNPSKFSFGGMGRWMFGKMMGANNVSTLTELRDLTIDMGGRLYPCQMSMDVMEIPAESFIAGVKDPVGVGYFLMEASDADITLFI